MADHRIANPAAAQSAAKSSAEELRAANCAVVEAFFASNLANPEERLALWDPDGVKELPFAPAARPRRAGRDVTRSSPTR